MKARAMSQAKGWRSIVAIAAVVGGIAAATYPIIVAPYMNPDPWSTCGMVFCVYFVV